MKRFDEELGPNPKRRFWVAADAGKVAEATKAKFPRGKVLIADDFLGMKEFEDVNQMGLGELGSPPASPPTFTNLTNLTNLNQLYEPLPSLPTLPTSPTTRSYHNPLHRLQISIDLWALASTSMVIGTTSTFAKSAAMLGHPTKL
jgi:hypothetical protein